RVCRQEARAGGRPGAPSSCPSRSSPHPTRVAPASPPDQNADDMQPLRKTPAWAALEEQAAYIRETHLRDLFAADPARGERMTVEAAGLYLDYSKHRATHEAICPFLPPPEDTSAT